MVCNRYYANGKNLGENGMGVKYIENYWSDTTQE